MKQQRKSKRFSQVQKQVSFRRLTFEALPEMWSFQILTTLLMAVPASILSKLITSGIKLRMSGNRYCNSKTSKN